MTRTEKNSDTSIFQNDTGVIIKKREISALDIEYFNERVTDDNGDPIDFSPLERTESIDTSIIESIVEPIIEDVIECFFSSCSGNSSPYFDITEEYKKLDFYERKPITLYKIRRQEFDDCETVSGIVLDLSKNEDFSRICQNGLDFAMPKCKEYWEKHQKLLAEKSKNDLCILDSEDSIEIEEEIKNEIRTLVTDTFKSLKGRTEYTLKGIYIIRNSTPYYLTTEEFDNIFESPYPLNLELMEEYLNKLEIEEIILPLNDFLDMKNPVDDNNATELFQKIQRDLEGIPQIPSKRKIMQKN